MQDRASPTPSPMRTGFDSGLTGTGVTVILLNLVDRVTLRGVVVLLDVVVVAVVDVSVVDSTTHPHKPCSLPGSEVRGLPAFARIVRGCNGVGRGSGLAPPPPVTSAMAYR